MYFFLWVLIFTFAYLILGLKPGGHSDSEEFGHNGDDYERLHSFWAIFIYSYRTAIGDLEAPNAELWETIELVYWKRKVMIYVIWVVWMLE